ncbi:MAG TPA: efflux RND transporter periplasmic adaptor subunit [Candidatus Saccharimonadales bacterium]|nr:efflux RND transporter periplasmic adaptor subunit [Candidatus Saccharimonadales bacterium]
MPEATIKPDLAALRIDAHKRGSRRAGKRLALVAVILVVLTAFAGGAYTLMNRAPSVQVATAEPADTGPQALLNASGYVTPQRRATVAAKITGRVTGVFFTEGMHVEKGFVLATLDDSDAQKTLAAAKADRSATQAGILDLQVQLQNAQTELERARQLNAAGIQTQQALDAATMTANSLRARIEYAQQQVLAAGARIQEAQQSVDNCVISAPFEGIIVSKDAQVGEMVSPISAGGGFTRTGIATIVDMASNEIQVDVNENYIARVKPAQEVQAVLDAYPDWKIPCHVRTIIPTADRQKATVEVRIAFDKLDPRILPDMGVKVTFLGDESRQTDETVVGVLVPQNAVRDNGGQKIVFLVRGDRVERNAVKVGASRGAQTQILAGILSGDTVVMSGPNNLRDGQAVTVRR